MLRVRVSDGATRARLLAGATAFFLDEGVAVPLSACASADELLLTSAPRKGLGKKQLVVRDGRRFAATLASLPLEGYKVLKAVLVAAATADAFGYADWIGGLPHPHVHDVSVVGGWKWSQYALAYGFALRSAMADREAAARSIQGAARGKAARRAVAELAASSAARRRHHGFAKHSASASQAAAARVIQRAVRTRALSGAARPAAAAVHECQNACWPVLAAWPLRELLAAGRVAMALGTAVQASPLRAMDATVLIGVLLPGELSLAAEQCASDAESVPGPALPWCAARRMHRLLGVAFACNKGRRRRE